MNLGARNKSTAPAMDKSISGVRRIGWIVPSWRKVDRDKESVVVYEIWTSRKIGEYEEGESTAPAGTTWVKLRGRPYFSKREYAVLELEAILSKKNAKPACHYAIVEYEMPPSSLQREIARGRQLV